MTDPAPATGSGGRDADWCARHDPRTTPEILADVARRRPEFAATIGAHPQAHPALGEWSRAPR